jgi:hypothetical protein
MSDRTACAGRQLKSFSRGAAIEMARHFAMSKIAAVSSQAKLSENDPLSWLYLNPAIEGFEAAPRYTFGVLRRPFRGRTNSAAEFVDGKHNRFHPPG